LNGFIDNGICQGQLFLLGQNQNQESIKIIITECNSNCPTCYGPTSENCLSCHEPNYLFEGKCVDSCPLKYYLDNSTSSCESKKFKQF